MEFYADTSDYDLITPDGYLTQIVHADNGTAEAELVIENIPGKFVGFKIDRDKVIFNIKSTLAQLGVDGRSKEIELDVKNRRATVKLHLFAIGNIAKKMLELLEVGAFIGKLFAMDDRRRVRDPFYLSRMFGRSDRWGKPLLSLGGLHGSNELILDKVDGRCVAYVTLKKGVVSYADTTFGLLPTLAKALQNGYPMRNLLSICQVFDEDKSRSLEENELLLVKTAPLHIRTVFGKVVNELLTPGFYHTSASVLQPDTQASGDIYELYGKSEREITDIPLEFYTLEPYREYVFFSDRDQLQSALDDPKVFFKAFETMPEPKEARASAFVVKGEQLLNLSAKDWVVRETHQHEFPGSAQTARQALMVERYIEQQPAYQFLKGMEDGVITSQGILLSRYFPSPLMKRMFLSDQVQRHLKGIYFQIPSKTSGMFFSHEDRAFLHDLAVFGIPCFWVDSSTGQILRYVEKQEHEAGLFVPLPKVDTFLKSTVFGIYGSNLITGNLENELLHLLHGLNEMKMRLDNPMLNPDTPLALVTGGGPGVMEVGNRVAKSVGILSCANMVDFRARGGDKVVNEQKLNPYVEAKMTYRLDRLVERQAEFNLDFPIFLMGGIGTDFEFYLEEVRRKVGSVQITPILLFGEKSYWKKKITSNYECNLNTGTIAGSEWISNCFYVVENAKEALEIYSKYFRKELIVGPQGPIFKEGFGSLLST